jgi:hypothetical protein
VAQALRIVGVVACSMLAAALTAVLVFSLAETCWRAALISGALVINLTGAVFVLFRGYARNSPRHRGRP